MATAAVAPPVVRGAVDDRPVDPLDAAFAVGATGLLAVFNRAGILSAADVHVAVSVGRLGGESDETVLLAAALAVRGVRQGSVCIDLGEQVRIDPELPWPDLADWYERVQASVLTTGDGPLRWDLDLLYLDRYWRQEIQVCMDLLDRATQPPPPVDLARLTAALDRHFPDGPEQRQAADVAARRWTTVLGGGPGTGKTTTIARLLAVLLDQPGPAPRIALAAPTGKAAARMQEAVQEVQVGFEPADRDRLGAAHRLDPAPAPRLPPRIRHPLPAPPRQPVALRHRGRRRDVDGVADDDGPTAGGGPSGGAADPGR